MAADEKIIMTSEMPSRYHNGVVLYIGGQTKTWVPGLSTAKLETRSKNVFMVEVTLMETDVPGEDAEDVRKLVNDATTQASDSTGTDDREVTKVDIRPQMMIFALDMMGHLLVVDDDMWRLMLESPTMA